MLWASLRRNRYGDDVSTSRPRLSSHA